MIAYSVGDKVVYKGGLYRIKGETASTYWLYTEEYDIQDLDSGTVHVGVHKTLLTPYHNDIKAHKKANPCQCGAHVTFIETSHSDWCPMFVRT